MTYTNTESPRSRARTTLIVAALALAAPVALAGCASAAPSEATHGSSPAEEAHGMPAVTLADGWAKAGTAGGMTGLFGTLENHGDHDLAITGIESEAAGSVELHEVTQSGVMQEIEGEVVVPAGGTFELAPGANHIMLMDLASDLLAGDEVAVTVEFDDGSSADLSALVKDYSGANEDYGSGHDDHAEH